MPRQKDLVTIQLLHDWKHETAMAFGTGNNPNVHVLVQSPWDTFLRSVEGRHVPVLFKAKATLMHFFEWKGMIKFLNKWSVSWLLAWAWNLLKEGREGELVSHDSILYYHVIFIIYLGNGFLEVIFQENWIWKKYPSSLTEENKVYQALCLLFSDSIFLKSHPKERVKDVHSFSIAPYVLRTYLLIVH